MAEESASTPPRVRGSGFNLRDVPVGATIRLGNDATAEVIDNPLDGMWLLCRYLTSPDDPGQVGTTEPVFVHDVAEVLAEP
jgi:hypothetical protein